MYQSYNHAVATPDDPMIVSDQTEDFKPIDSEMGDDTPIVE